MNTKHHRITLLDVEAMDCKRCGLCDTRKTVVNGRGDLDAPVLFVGEAPGADEDEVGLPFVGKSGALLGRMIKHTGYAESDVRITNVVRCRPPNNRKPEIEEIERCERFLHREIAIVSPKVIVALGATATEVLTGQAGITKLRGKFHRYLGIPVMVTFHPAYFLRLGEVEGSKLWERDMEAVRTLLEAPGGATHVPYELRAKLVALGDARRRQLGDVPGAANEAGKLLRDVEVLAGEWRP